MVEHVVGVGVVEDSEESGKLLDYGLDPELGVFVLYLVPGLGHVEAKELVCTFEVLDLVLRFLLRSLALKREDVVGVICRLMPDLILVVALLHPAKERIVI